MEATRRDFLGAMACAFAAAKIPCRIPPIVEDQKAESGYQLIKDSCYRCWGKKNSTPAIFGAEMFRETDDKGNWVSIVLAIPGTGKPALKSDFEFSFGA